MRFAVNVIVNFTSEMWHLTNINYKSVTEVGTNKTNIIM